MASPAVDHFEIEALKGSLLAGASAASTLSPSVCDGSVFATGFDRLSEPNVEGIHCVRGVLLVIGAEALAAFTLFGLWQFWHILR